MRLFFKDKDGGPESNVTGYWLVEAKSLFSVALLCFEEGSREAFHGHAFNSCSWLLSGDLREERLKAIVAQPLSMLVLAATSVFEYWAPSLKPILTDRGNIHKVYARKRSWVLTFRGPWANTWPEVVPDDRSQFGRLTYLEHGRRVVGV
jgi:hypothetical protein